MQLLRLNLPTVIRAKGVRLMPGLNRVEDAAAERFLSHPLIQHRVRAGEIQVVKDLPPAPLEGADEDDAAPGSDGRTAAEIVAEIAETYDMARLREWLTDRRKTVSAAAARQIARIDAAAAKKADDA